MVNQFKNANIKPSLPEIITIKHGGYRVEYGELRGSRDFTTREAAEQNLVDYIDYRVAQMARAMFELTRLKRKVLK